jgi:hypothetical protein
MAGRLKSTRNPRAILNFVRNNENATPQCSPSPSPLLVVRAERQAPPGIRFGLLHLNYKTDNPLLQLLVYHVEKAEAFDLGREAQSIEAMPSGAAT